MGLRSKLGILIISALAATGASAGLLTPGTDVQVSNQAGNAFTPSPQNGDSNGLYKNLRFKLDNSRTYHVSAGQFVLDYSSDGDAWTEFLSFCLEPDVYLMPFSNPYAVKTLSGSGYNAAIGELWGRHYGSVTNDLAAAAFQVAIWELSYDGDGSLNTGAFQLVSNNAVRNLASSWLNSLDGSGPIANGLKVLGSNANLPDRQDLITQVSAPGTLALFAIGVLAIALRRKLVRS